MKHSLRKYYAKEVTETETTSVSESGLRTIVELSNELAVRVKHDISEEALSTDEQIEALEIIDSLKSDLIKTSRKKLLVINTV